MVDYQSPTKAGLPASKLPRQAGEWGQRLRQVGILSSIPMVLVASPLVGFVVGRWADRRLGWEPALMVVGVGLGLVAGIRQTVRLIKRAEREERHGNPSR